MIKQYVPVMKAEYAQKVAKQIESGWVGCGEAVSKFERTIRQQILEDNNMHVVSTTSGTNALILGLLSLDLPRGSTILFPAYTFLAGANAAKFLGFKIRLVDIKMDTLCMNPDKIVVSPDVSAIIFVNHNGYDGIDLQCVRQICDTYNIPMIEDCCQGFGIPNIGKTGDIAAFSFSVPKILTTGQGGCSITKDYKKAERMEEIRDHGDNWRTTKIHTKLGINLKFNDVSASLGQAQLDNFDEIKTIRKNIWNWYSNEIDIYRFGLDFTWMVCYLAKNPEKVISTLHLKEIQATRYYKPICQNIPYKTDEKYPIADFIAEHLLYLPSSHNLTKKDVKSICSIIKETENE